MQPTVSSSTQPPPTQTKLSLRALGIAWIAGATLFLIVNLVLMPMVLEVHASVFLRYIASLLLGQDALMDASVTVLAVGVLLHYALSLVFTLVIVFVIFRWGLWVGIIGGAILGLALYGINLYAMTRFFDWFFATHSTVLLLSHVLFGATVGGVYELLDDYDTPFLKGE